MFRDWASHPPNLKKMATGLDLVDVWSHCVTFANKWQDMCQEHDNEIKKNRKKKTYARTRSKTYFDLPVLDDPTYPNNTHHLPNLPCSKHLMDMISKASIPRSHCCHLWAVDLLISQHSIKVTGIQPLQVSTSVISPEFNPRWLPFSHAHHHTVVAHSEVWTPSGSGSPSSQPPPWARRRPRWPCRSHSRPRPRRQCLTEGSRPECISPRCQIATICHNSRCYTRGIHPCIGQLCLR